MYTLTTQGPAGGWCGWGGGVTCEGPAPGAGQTAAGRLPKVAKIRRCALPSLPLPLAAGAAVSQPRGAAHYIRNRADRRKAQPRVGDGRPACALACRLKEHQGKQGNCIDRWKLSYSHGQAWLRISCMQLRAEHALHTYGR